MQQGFDVVGDVHGMRRTLDGLLGRLGFREDGAGLHHPDGRELVFVGDLLDRGPDPLGCLERVEELVDQGVARMVLGNHELNALHFMAGHRPEDRRSQCRSTLRQIEADRSRWVRARAFLLRVPTRLLLDGGRLRVVHACWDPAALAALPEVLDGDEVLRQASMSMDWAVFREDRRPGALAWASELVIKGPEEPVEPYRDREGRTRTEARVPWWEGYPADAPLVVFGHYRFPWPSKPRERGRPVPEPALLGPGQNAVCVDFGVDQGRWLTAYRYPEGEFVRQAELDGKDAR